MANAIYFMGTNKGTSKKSGKDFWCVNVLWLNTFGNYEIKPMFVTEGTYSEVNGMGMARGTAVDVTTNLGGGLDAIAPSTIFKPLNLGEVITHDNKR